MQIDSSVPPPEPEVKKRGRKPKDATEKPVKSTKPAKASSSLLNAMKFISVAQQKNGTFEQVYCKLTNHWALAQSGALTVGHPIEEDLEICPNSDQLIAALSKSGADLSITHMPDGQLSVVSGNLRAMIPCVNFAELPDVAPDTGGFLAVGNSIRDTFNIIKGLLVENSPNHVFGAALFQNETVVATNGVSLMEAWHGVTFPYQMLLPKVFVDAVADTKLDITYLAYSQNSITFWFANNAFIKTQLVAGNPPNYQHFIDAPKGEVIDVAENFFDVANTIVAFSRDGSIHFREGFVYSSTDLEHASKHKVSFDTNISFNAGHLAKYKGNFNKLIIDCGGQRGYFFGPIARGVLSAVIFDDIPY